MNALAGSSTQMTVGSNRNGWLDYAGDLDEVAVYDRALSAEEVAAHHRAGVAADTL